MSSESSSLMEVFLKFWTKLQLLLFKNSEQSLKIFDSHSKDFYGIPHSFRKCTLLSIEGLENLLSYLKMSCSEVGVVPFEIKVVLISDCQPDVESFQNSHKNEESPQVTKITQNSLLTESESVQVKQQT